MSWKQNQSDYLWSNAESKFSGNVSAKTPLQGITLQHDGHQSLPVDQLFQVFGFEAGDTTDAQWLVRQNDLAVTLPYSEERPTGVECYWRLSEDEANACQVETWVSANTRLLDEQIVCHCTSQFKVSQVQVLNIDPAGSVEDVQDLGESATFVIGESTSKNQLDREVAFLCDLKDTDLRLLIAGYPGDQSKIVVDFDGEKMTIEQHLNFGFLEKGVIRRARLLAAVIPPVPAITVEVDRCLQNFYHSPLPLTV